MNSRPRQLYALVLGAIYAVTAYAFAARVALQLAPANLFPIARYGLTLLLLLAGFIVLGRVVLQQREPVHALGFWWSQPQPRYLWQRSGGAAGLGAAIGWTTALLLVLPVAATGNLYPLADISMAAFGLTAASLLGSLLAVCAREALLRSFVLQRLSAFAGPTAATLATAILGAVLLFHGSQMSRGELIYLVLEQAVLCVAMLRSGSLWLSIALAWTLRAVVVSLFGLPLLGDISNGMVQSAAGGPVWLGGADSGPAASAFAPLVMLLALVVVVRTTRRDAIAEIRGAAYPVDMDANRAPNATHAAYHEAAALPPLVQIAPAPPDATSNNPR